MRMCLVKPGMMKPGMRQYVGGYSATCWLEFNSAACRPLACGIYTVQLLVLRSRLGPAHSVDRIKPRVRVQFVHLCRP